MKSMNSVLTKAALPRARLIFEIVEGEMRKRNFGVLSTVSTDVRPHSVGVLYGISSRRAPLALYVVTDQRSKKVRNIQGNPKVSFSIPLHRRLLSFLPPNSIQFQGAAKILPISDETAKETFSHSFVLRKTLSLEETQREGVFLRILPDPVIHTYGVGISLLGLLRNIEGGTSRVEIPPERRV